MIGKKINIRKRKEKENERGRRGNLGESDVKESMEIFQNGDGTRGREEVSFKLSFFLVVLGSTLPHFVVTMKGKGEKEGRKMGGEERIKKNENKHVKMLIIILILGQIKGKKTLRFHNLKNMPRRGIHLKEEINI